MSIADWFISRITRRPPDFVIGGDVRPYLKRWFVIPRNPLFNIYLHQFLRSDDDRALHDHPWANCSFLLKGFYAEHLPGDAMRYRVAGDVVLRPFGAMAHRIRLIGDETGIEQPCWTLFITGPRYRSWGFHCPEQGWIHWERFTAADDPGAVGPGCDA